MEETEKKGFIKKVTTHEDPVIRVFGTFGLIIVLVLLIIGAVYTLKYTYIGISRLASGAVNLSTGIFSDNNTNTQTKTTSDGFITTSSSATKVQSGSTFTISWNHEDKKTDGSYSIYYPCTNGIYFSAMTMSGKAEVLCNKFFEFTNTNNQITLTASSTLKNASVDVPVSILFTPNGQSQPSVTGIVMITVASQTSNTTPTVTVNNSNSSSNSSNNYTSSNNSNSNTYTPPRTTAANLVTGTVYFPPENNYSTYNAYSPYSYGYSNNYSSFYNNNFSNQYTTPSYYPYNSNYTYNNNYPYNYNYPYNNYSCQSPVITSSPYAYGTIGSGFSHSFVNGTQGYPTTWNATGLPSGLTFYNNVISGTPTQVGTFTVTVYANNSCGNATQTLTITISNYGNNNGNYNCFVAPTITSPTFINANVNQYVTYQIVANNLASYYSASNLPSGLTINQSTGFISGVPTMIETRNISIQAQGSCGTATSNLTLNVGTNYNTPYPQYPTYPQYQYPTYPNYPTYPAYNRADLRVTFVEYGILNSQNQFIKTTYLPRSAYKIAVRFRIENIGSAPSGSFNFTAHLPTYSSQTYNSNTQAGIPVGGNTEYTLGFDQAVPGYQQFTVRVDPTNYVQEINEGNNEMSVNLSIQ